MNEPSQEILEGEVTKITPYGAFIKLADGRFGMVHISEIAYEYINKVEDVLKLGDKIKVVLLASQKDKLNFSIKRAQKPQMVGTKNPLNKERTNDADSINNIKQNKQPQFKEQNSQSAAAKFEDMLNKFKQTSDEKLSSFKKVVNTRRGTNRKNSFGRR
ncbi:MAG: S1 RNA-binding domain-containing protein [Oscillospiraceae bacterium]